MFSKFYAKFFETLLAEMSVKIFLSHGWALMYLGQRFHVSIEWLRASQVVLCPKALTEIPLLIIGGWDVNRPAMYTIKYIQHLKQQHEQLLQQQSHGFMDPYYPFLCGITLSRD